MSERDDLAKLVFIADNNAAIDPESEWKQLQATPKYLTYAYHVAEAILSAGYRKPQQITAVEELDALPDAVLILTEQGGYWESIKRMDGKNWWKEPGARDVSPSADLTLPAIVLHVGSGE